MSPRINVSANSTSILQMAQGPRRYADARVVGGFAPTGIRGSGGGQKPLLSHAPDASERCRFRPPAAPDPASAAGAVAVQRLVVVAGAVVAVGAVVVGGSGVGGVAGSATLAVN